jgi:hypothetical protein
MIQRNIFILNISNGYNNNSNNSNNNNVYWYD